MATTKKTSARAEKIEKIHRDFSAAVLSLKKPETWEKMLATAARFHKYSFQNKILIWAQNPDATRCAGYKQWLSLGYQVRKGETGLSIFAPMTVIKKDEKGEPEKDDDGQPIRMTLFRPVTVFDASQISPLENAQPFPGSLLEFDPAISGEDGGLGERLEGFIVGRGWRVVRVPLGVVLGGDTNFVEKVIRVNSDRSLLAQTKTLAHEVAHALLHGDIDPKEYAKACGSVRSLAETEAESAAFALASAWGLDTSDYSIPYVAGWSEQKPEVLEASARAVCGVVSEVLGEIGG